MKNKAERTNIPTAQSRTIPSTMSSKSERMIWGLSLHAWEEIMRGSLLAVGGFGLIAGLATWFVVSLQREEIATSKNEFETYKLEAGTKISEANASAAEAGRKAEAERLERLRLEAILGPRSLSLAQQQQIAALWAPFAGKRVSVTTYSLDGEGATLATQIIAVLNAASIEVDNRLASVMPMGGFSLGVHVNGDDANLVRAIREALAAVGGLAVAPQDAPPNTGPMMGMSPAEGGNPIAAAILVGIKPVRTIR